MTSAGLLLVLALVVGIPLGTWAVLDLYEAHRRRRAESRWPFFLLNGFNLFIQIAGTLMSGNAGPYAWYPVLGGLLLVPWVVIGFRRRRIPWWLVGLIFAYSIFGAWRLP